MCHHYGLQGHTRQIVINWEHWGMLVIKGQENQEMTGGLGLLSHQEVEMVIPEWWTWWRWLVHSPTAWKVSLESLKFLTLVPNPVGISPKRTWRVGEKGYSCMITSYVHASILPMFRIIGSCIILCIAFCLKHVFRLQVLFCTYDCWSCFIYSVFECVQKLKNP